MNLIIAEKPLIGQSIAKVIPGSVTKRDGCLYVGDYVITWAYGHLLELMQPHDYDPVLKEWKMASLPIFFERWKQKPRDGKSGQGRSERLEQIGRLLKQADCVIHAGDPDDEGQLIVDEILRWFKYDGPVKRIDTADTTEAALSKAMRNLKDNEQFVNAGWAAYARSVADLTVGINLTRYFTLSNSFAKLTVGRVQTPTLGMVINRDLQIEGHSKVRYFDVIANLGIDGKSVPAEYAPAKDDPNTDEKGRILNYSYAQEKMDMLRNATLDGVKVSKRLHEESPPLPFNLVKLQSYCSSRFGYNPTEVMELTQSLRDKYNAITYNRSDCQYLSENHFAEAPATMATVVRNISFKPSQIDMKLKSACFNDDNISAHHAIIPQNISLDLSQLTERERNVYLAICKYYMAQFLPPAQKERTRLSVALADGGVLTATSTEILKQGYLSIFKGVRQEERSLLSGIASGVYRACVEDVTAEQRETRPPVRYTKASLNEDMTRIARYVDDPSIRNLLKEKDKGKEGENGSIGTTATRPSIIDGLIERGFLQEEGKKIKSTPLAREFFRILPDELKKPDMTAYWWVIQEDIRSGTAAPEMLFEHVMEMVNRILNTTYPKVNHSLLPGSAGRSVGSGRGEGGVGESLGKCPRCGAEVVETQLSFGCSSWRSGCRFAIWKKSKLAIFSRTTFTKKDAQALLSGKRIKKSALVSKDGKPFEAYLRMEDDASRPYGPSFAIDVTKRKKGVGA